MAMKALINGVWRSDYAPEPDLGWLSAALAPYPCRNSWDWRSLDTLALEDCHIYVSYACPFAHRVIAARELLGLQDLLSISILDPDWSGPDGWVFSNHPGCTPDHIGGKQTLHEIYTLTQPNFTGKVTVPALWSRREGRLASSESLEILRLITTASYRAGQSPINLCPQHHRETIDEVNTLIDACISSAVYRVSSSVGTEFYERERAGLFDALGTIEARLEGHKFLVGDNLTEADLVLFATMLRFDAVYYERFGCNTRRLSQMPNIAAHMHRVAAIEAIGRTINFDHIIKHYFTLPEFAYTQGPILAVQRDTPRA